MDYILIYICFIYKMPRDNNTNNGEGLGGTIRKGCMKK